jgi:hypothetical protein
MNRTKKVLKNIGKFLVFSLLMGLGGGVLTDMVILPLVREWSWLLGTPKEGSAYYTFVQVILWALWGFIGVMLAVSVYPMIFKQPPARWMFITVLSIGGLNWILGAFVIGLSVWFGEIGEIELETWNDFVRSSSGILTLWYAFRSLATSGGF